MACAHKFAANGYQLILNARREQPLRELADNLHRQYGTRTLVLPFDVRDREEAKRQIANLPAEWQDIDILVNNAGLALGLEKEYEGDFADWDTMIDTNIKALLSITRFVVPGMVARNKGHIINIGSVARASAAPIGPHSVVYCPLRL